MHGAGMMMVRMRVRVRVGVRVGVRVRVRVRPWLMDLTGMVVGQVVVAAVMAATGVTVLVFYLVMNSATVMFVFFVVLLLFVMRLLVGRFEEVMQEGEPFLFGLQFSVFAHIGKGDFFLAFQALPFGGLLAFFASSAGFFSAFALQFLAAFPFLRREFP